MSAIPAQTLFEETKCYACYGLSQADLIKAGLLNRILGGESSSGPGYLSYVALITQAGVAAPTVDVLQNTLGGTPVWTRDNVGQYRVTLAGAFPAAKTFYMVSTSSDAATTLIASALRFTDNFILVQSGDPVGGTTVDDYFLLTPFEIRVYP